MDEDIVRYLTAKRQVGKPIDAYSKKLTADMEALLRENTASIRPRLINVYDRECHLPWIDFYSKLKERFINALWSAMSYDRFGPS